MVHVGSDPVFVSVFSFTLNASQRTADSISCKFSSALDLLPHSNSIIAAILQTMSSYSPGSTAASHDGLAVVYAIADDQLRMNHSLTHSRRASRSPYIYPFLDLPAELRNEIYSYVFGDMTIDLQLDDNSTGVISRIFPGIPPGTYPTHPGDIDAVNADPQKPSNTFALLKTCRQINTETRKLPYKLNAFVLSYNGALENLVKDRVLAARVRLIRTVRFGLYALSPSYIDWGFATMVQTLAEFVEPSLVEVVVVSETLGAQESFIILMKEKVTKLVKDAVGQEVEVRIYGGNEGD